ncbi:hypothetical protein [Maribellus sediminis]|uniref:hypothetical protein n=1 Tax=Maribellus sediminis TaxID=2696285 RepID=UPI00142FE0FF|nr:hypothetical protein [Maribellus sediminis]
MAAPQFSESQFVIGFLREYLNQFPFFPHPFWSYVDMRVPSTKEEVETGADVIFKRCSHSVFFQFKRSHKLHYNGRFWLKKPERDLPRSFFDYYRFKVYNSPESQQFEKLRDVSTINPFDRSYYVAPLFHTTASFKKYFYRQEILKNSVLIPCKQFRKSQFNPPKFNINDGKQHYILYNKRLEGKLLSEPKEITVLNAKLMDEPLNREETGSQPIRKILEWCRWDSSEKKERMNSDFEFNSVADGIAYLSAEYDIIWQPIFF